MSVMERIVAWLLRLPDDAPAGAWRLGFERPLPGWAWLLVMIAAAAIGAWSVRAMAIGPRRRVVIGSMRALLLLLLVLLATGPILTLPRERTEPDWVLVMADRSASMRVGDVERDGAMIQRDAQLDDAIRANAAVWKDLRSTRRVVFLGFDAGLRELEIDADGLPRLGPADGLATEIGPAISAAMDRAAARPVSGIVLLSDGRTTAPPERSLLRRLEAEGVRIHAVPLGADRPSGDHAIRAIDAPQRAFVRDEVPIEVDLDRSAGVGGALRVKLVDEASGRLLDAAEFDDAETGRRRITLVGRADEPGERTWRVEIEPEGRDIVPENNGRSLRIEIVDRPIRVLYVEGAPRWEYRYLKNLLVRERGVESSVMLLSADRDFAQEGNAPLTRLPRSREEFAAYDLVILGDVPAGAFSAAQMEAMKEMVSSRGAGLLWIGGPNSVPRAWKGSAMEDLLPLRGSLELERHDEAVTMRPTPRAARLGLLRLTGDDAAPWPEEIASASSGWSALEWAQRLEPNDLKPTAEVLAETASGDGGRAAPLLVSMPYGAGQVMYMATDETWRWRYGRGETMPERFWLQILRALARAGMQSEDRPIQLVVEPRRAEIGDPVRIEATVRDSDPTRSAAARLQAIVSRAGAGAAGEGVAVELSPVEGIPGRFSGTLFPDRSGTFTIALDGHPGVTAELEVSRVDQESANVQTDHGLLAQMAEETGGEVIQPAMLHRLLRGDLLPNRAVTIENPRIHLLWSTPLALILLVLVPAVEWSVRRWSRLA